MASSMVAEATEASVADSVQDGASSIDEGSMDGASARSAATPFQISAYLTSVKGALEVRHFADATPGR